MENKIEKRINEKMNDKKEEIMKAYEELCTICDSSEDYLSTAEIVHPDLLEDLKKLEFRKISIETPSYLTDKMENLYEVHESLCTLCSTYNDYLNYAELNYPNIFEKLKQLKYEYKPFITEG